MKKRYLCIHCHFYQPPRENPWLEQIEVQDLAAPFHDWNERINTECYAPNSESRILNEKGKIVDIVNNYSRISFNFGPTLLSWIADKDPKSYEKIIDGDKKSIKEFSGHGNALAQVYNHIIMPLAEKKDKITQVVWGIEDFRSRFNREPEGMWLAETAVNTETLEILADHNIKFTILSPYQAKTIRRLDSNEDEWHDANHGQIDPSQSYLYKLKNGKSIALFFYDGHISQAVAFDSLLKDGAEFSKRLLSGYSNERDHDQLLNIATDGETYGHHFKFGEMALTFAMKDLKDNHDIELTNYGEYLEKYPPQYEVKIHENSSWSCSHGVGRWQEDCGCRIGYSGDWNQQWRKPLRESLNKLKSKLDYVFEEESSPYFNEPWDARNGYIQVILNRTQKTISRFFNLFQKKELSWQEQLTCLKLLEMQRHSMLMFTSCGWFFDDISGIETIQILKHACRSIQLASQPGHDLEDDFVEHLGQCESNIPKYKNGKNIYNKYVKPSEVDLTRAIAHYAITTLLPNQKGYIETEDKEAYSFQIHQEQFEKIRHTNSTLAIGQVKVTSKITLESEEAVFAALHLGLHDFQCKISGLLGTAKYNTMKNDILNTFDQESLTQVIRKLDYYFPDDFHALNDLFVEERRKVLANVTEDIFKKFQKKYFRLYHANERLMNYHLEMDAPIHKEFQHAACFVLSYRLKEKILDEGKVEGIKEYSQEIKDIIEEAKNWYVEPDLELAAKELSKLILDKMDKLRETCSEAYLKDIIRFLTVYKDFSLPINLWYIQNAYFNLCISHPHLREDKTSLMSELDELLGFEIG